MKNARCSRWGCEKPATHFIPGGGFGFCCGHWQDLLDQEKADDEKDGFWTRGDQ